MLTGGIRPGKAAPWAAAAALLALVAASAFTAKDQTWEEGSHALPGEALFHGVESIHSQTVNHDMPLSGLLAAFIGNHATPVAAVRMMVLVIAARMILIFSIGCRLGSAVTGLSATALFLLFLARLEHGEGPTLAVAYSVFVLLAAAALVRRARDPSPGNSALLGVAVGIGLLFRSPLAFFTPLLALFELFFLHRGALRRYWRHLLILCVVPYLFLIPWIRMNWILSGRIIPFEQGRADRNVIAGALGFIDSVPIGSLDILIADQIGEPRDSGAVLRWAAGTVLRDPFDFALSCLARVKAVLSTHPLMFLLAGASLLKFSRRIEFLELGLLAGYFLGIHCLMAINLSYFVALWPMLAALAAPLLVPAWTERFWNGSWDMRLADGCIMACMLPLAGAASFALLKVNAYAGAALSRRPGSAAALEGAIALAPADAWLLSELGLRALKGGDYSGAISVFEKVVQMKPKEPIHRFHLALARARNGNADPSLLAPLLGGNAFIETRLRVKTELLRAIVSQKKGRASRAKEFLRSAGAWNRSDEPAGNTASADPDWKKMTGLYSRHGIDLALLLLELWPDRDGPVILALLRELPLLDPFINPDLLILTGEYALSSGDPKAAGESLRFAKTLVQDPARLRRIESLLARIDSADPVNLGRGKARARIAP